MKLRMRQFIGVCMLAVTVGITAGISMSNVLAPKYSFTIGFGRGDRMVDDSEAIIDEIASVIVKDPQFRAEIVGYAYPGGDPEPEMRLSQARANAVSAALSDRGVFSSRVSVAGRGGRDAPSRLKGEPDYSWERRASRAEVTVSK